MRNVQHALCVPLQLHFRMGVQKQCVVRWKALSDTRLQERTDLVMIQSFIYRNMDVPVQKLAPEKKNELSHRGEGLRKMRAVIEARNAVK